MFSDSRGILQSSSNAQDEDFRISTHQLATLSLAEVRAIHEHIANQFAASSDPIEPRGERQGGLLESAVARQHAGVQNRLLYPNPVLNATTLVFGLCKNHPFHNGNKRTALISMLVHLDRNHRIIESGINHWDVYDFIIRLANGSLHEITHAGKRLIRDGVDVNTPGSQFECCRSWLTAHTRDINNGERQIRMRELRKILANFGYELRSPVNNFSDIVRVEEQQKPSGWLRRPRSVIVEHKVFQISCSGMSAVVPISTLKDVRRRCELTERHGVDSVTFYSQADRLDYFLNYYRKILQKLAAE